MSSHECDYPTYLGRRQAELETEERQHRLFDRKLAREEDWIRQGVKARRTRNEGRVRALEELRAVRRARRERPGNVRLAVQEAEKTGKLVIEARDVCYAHGDNSIVRDFSTVVLRGDRVGIIGPNGAGKTTLLKILLKQTAPTTGSVRHGARFQAAYFDQLRLQLDAHKSVQENIAQGNDFIDFNGRRRHVIGYLGDFLFSPERCRTPVHVLSGGEKNRLLLAALFVRPANVLVLDEPTNDLDAETLDLLEELLFDFQGTLLLVSHDREFLNRVVTSTIVFEGGGRLGEYPGGYDDWLSQRPPPETASPGEAGARQKTGRASGAATGRRLGYLQKRELEELPQRIERLEAELQGLYAGMSDIFYYKKEKGDIAAAKMRLEELERAIAEAYRRWEELETP